MGSSTGEETDQDMCWHLVTPPPPSTLYFLAEVPRFKPILGPSYFLLGLKDCSMLETFILLTEVRVNEHMWPQ